MTRETMEPSKFRPTITVGEGYSANLREDLSAFLELLLHYHEHLAAKIAIRNLLDIANSRLYEPTTDTEMVSKLKDEIVSHQERLAAINREIRPLEKSLDLMHQEIIRESLQFFIFDALIDTIITKLEPEQIVIFKHSTAYQIFKANFVELIKNSFDAVVMRYLEDNTATPVVEINVSLEISDRIRFTMTDNGSGFPPVLLSKLSSAEGINEYINANMERYALSTKHDKSGDSTYLFGGTGKGLQMFLAYGTRGKAVGLDNRSDAPVVIIDEYSSIAVRNNPGAQLEITSSLEPVRFVHNVEDTESLESVPLKPFALNRKKHVTTHEMGMFGHSAKDTTKEDEETKKPEKK